VDEIAERLQTIVSPVGIVKAQRELRRSQIGALAAGSN